MNKWFTADTHIGHTNCALKWRGFSSVEEHDELIIQNWNTVIKPEDDVFHLGDVVMGTFWTNIEKVKRLNGNIFLVLGNHDRIATRYGHSQKEYEKKFDIYSEVFADWDYSLLMDVDNKRLLLHHMPYDGDHVEEVRFKEHRPTPGGHDFLIHGHIHDLWDKKDNQINVGVDVRGMTPVHLDELLSWT